GIWNVGYSGFLEIGSSLVHPAINGRTVTYEMTAHDPGGFKGLVVLRMNKDWSSFRVREFRFKEYYDPQMPQKLELYFDKVQSP
ncbi:MAG: hypothetical protein GWP91_03815, partial [Rhodobacterales bacterium]|nr:hypothetical protein [Rhodobacterales bacterium]